MKFTEEELYNIAYNEYEKAEFLPKRNSAKWYSWNEGIKEWAYYSSEEEYETEESVREELKKYIEEEKIMDGDI